MDINDNTHQRNLKTVGITGKDAGVESGFTYVIFRNVQALLGISVADLAKYSGIPAATLQRRNSADLFTPKESDAIYRAVVVYSIGLIFYGDDHQKTKEWIATNSVSLGGRSPLQCIRYSALTDLVESVFLKQPPTLE